MVMTDMLKKLQAKTGRAGRVINFDKHHWARVRDPVVVE